MARIWRMELDDKVYEIDPDKDVTISDLEKMQSWYGDEFGRFYAFTNAASTGDPRGIRCLIWIAKRKAGEHVPDDARNMKLPDSFGPGVFLASLTSRDPSEDDETEDDGDPLGSGSSARTKTRSGTVQSE